MTTAESVTSPPTSPPAKRVKTDQTPLSPGGTTSIPSHTIAAPAPASAPDASKMTVGAQAPRLLVKKLSDKARLPTRGSAFAAGYDVYAAKETTIPARGKALVDTDIAISVPADTCKSPASTLL